MLRILQIIGITGFFVCLAIMYLTPYGVRGMREYDPAFQMPDMKFHYSVARITRDFEKIGTEGRAHYQKYLVLDSVFVFCFGILMLTITGSLFTGVPRDILFAVCVFRGIFDLLENCFLLIVLRNFSAVNSRLILVCSCFTTLKFLMLYIWVIAVAIQLSFLGITKIRGNPTG